MSEKGIADEIIYIEIAPSSLIVCKKKKLKNPEKIYSLVMIMMMMMMLLGKHNQKPTRITYIVKPRGEESDVIIVYCTHRHNKREFRKKKYSK